MCIRDSSSVASVLASKAIGDRLVAVFVDHGLLREGEVDYVCLLYNLTLPTSDLV